MVFEHVFASYWEAPLLKWLGEAAEGLEWSFEWWGYGRGISYFCVHLTVLEIYATHCADVNKIESSYSVCWRTLYTFFHIFLLLDWPAPFRVTRISQKRHFSSNMGQK